MGEPSPVRAFLVGPTGVGKTDVALIVAKELGAEIINIDSRQIYRRLETATAKPTLAQRRAVRHHLVDFLDPSDRCSAGRFAEMVSGVLADLARRGVTALAVGGAGLYVDACLGRFHPLPAADDRLREGYRKVADREGAEALHRRLQDLDPATAERLAPRDTQRVIRALEVAESTGLPLSERFKQAALALCPPETPLFYLTRERRELYARIESRCLAMVAAGLPEEVRDLLEGGLSLASPGLKTLGYSEWGMWVNGRIDREAAMELFIRNSRRYAKRQETWFRNRHPGRIEVKVLAGEAPEETARRVLDALEKAPLPPPAGRLTPEPDGPNL